MKYLVILFLGLILGAGGVFYLLRVPRAGAMPGKPIQSPKAGAEAPGTAIITLDERLFDEVVGSIFRDLPPPKFQLAERGAPASDSPLRHAVLQSTCTNTVTILPEAGGIKTRVQFQPGKISLPLAFSGSYSLMGNCMQFKGWAQSTLQLSFDQSKQTVYGQVNVEGVNLEGVAPVANGLVTVFVQNGINERVNPLEVLGAPQLAPVIPVKASAGAVKAQVKDVRAEILDGSLRLHITYGFNGERRQQSQG